MRFFALTGRLIPAPGKARDYRRSLGRALQGEEAKQKARTKLGKNSEITRFSGLGEISPDEWGLRFFALKGRLIPAPGRARGSSRS